MQRVSHVYLSRRADGGRARAVCSRRECRAGHRGPYCGAAMLCTGYARWRYLMRRVMWTGRRPTASCCVVRCFVVVYRYKLAMTYTMGLGPFIQLASSLGWSVVGQRRRQLSDGGAAVGGGDRTQQARLLARSAGSEIHMGQSRLVAGRRRVGTAQGGTTAGHRPTRHSSDVARLPVAPRAHAHRNAQSSTGRRPS